MSRQRCINIDWLEVFTLESPNFYPMDAVWFQQHGWKIRSRDYGTPQYREMFTIYMDDDPFVEIRRNPYSIRREGGIFLESACHIRLTNRACYREDPIGDLKIFLEWGGYRYPIRGQHPLLCGISRIDICLDFLQFDTGKKVPIFIREYMTGKYAKIGQSRLAAHGKDCYTDKFWNSLKWGSPSSMCSTKLYCKTLEMKEVGVKPYIIDAWVASGLLFDKYDEQQVWRLEFSLNSDCKRWVKECGEEKEDSSEFIVSNTLEQYATRQRLITVFHNLCAHYFRFVRVEKGKSKYKSPVQKLIIREDGEKPYKPAPLKSKGGAGRMEKIIAARLQKIVEDPNEENEIRASAKMMYTYFRENYYWLTHKARE